MPIPKISDLTFVRREAVACRTADGVVTTIPLTVCRNDTGVQYNIPDDPEQLPLVNKLLDGSFFHG